ncbi:MAG: Tim44 domain-containing protein [Desulfovibrionales bacterium]|nr:Tim44 domain-containing protein [Desulfovibrionales bacterium]
MLVISLFLATLSEVAEAKRLGGGGSFGSRPSYSQKFQKPNSPASKPSQQAAPAASPMGGRGGMFGGLLGGMLMGGLLGSLFFGGPFSGLSFIDLLLVGGGLFLLFRFLRSRRPAMQTAGGGQQSPGMSGWDTLRTHPAAPSAPAGPTLVTPPGFDTEEFLQGAKTAYTALQAAWDRRDLDTIREFTSAEVFTEISAQAKADPQPGRTEILLLEAQIVEVRSLGNQTVATVLFDAMLREDGAASHAEQAREAWHFSRYETQGKPTWVVEGIQQLA